MGGLAIFDNILHNWCKFVAFFEQRRGPRWLYWLAMFDNISHNSYKGVLASVPTHGFSLNFSY